MTQMDPNTDDTLLARWLSGEIGETELQELERRPDYEVLLRMRAAFDALESPSFDKDRIWQGVRKGRGVSRIVPLYRRAWFAAAASILLLLGVSYFTFDTVTKETGNAETAMTRLPDDSQVMLNAGSSVSYDRWNWKGERRVQLEGEAYFRVSKGAKFTVSTDLGNVSVLGTQFNVKAREERFYVVCYEGKVKVEANGRSIVLTAGESIVFRNGMTTGIMPGYTDAPEWQQHEIRFSDERLEEVLQELSRQYGISFSTTSASPQLFSGLIPTNDLNATLRILEATYHLEARREGQSILLVPADVRP